MTSPTFSVTEPVEPAYVRSPVTATRLGVASLVVVFMYLALRNAAEMDFARAFSDLLQGAPHWLVSGVVGVFQIAFLAPAALGLLAQIGLRRFARLGRMLLTAVVCAAGLVAMSALVGDKVLPLLPLPNDQVGVGAAGLVGRSGYGIGAAFPTTMDLGVLAACMFIDRSHWSGRSRWAGRVLLAFGVLAQLGVSFAHPANIAAALAIAAASALLVQLALGVPNTRPRAQTVGEILQRLGHRPVSVERFGGFRGFAGFRVQLAGGRQLFVKIVSRDSWAALLPVRMYRAVRFRDVGQDRPFRSLRSVVEHEALCSLKAFSDGVPTTRLAEIAEFPPDSMLMAFDGRPLQSLRDLPPERRTPQLVASVWSVVAALQESHTVHRRLNADALLVDEAGAVVLVEFSSASLGVVGPALSTDVAEVLAATAPLLGAEQAVEYAIAGVGPVAVAAALPRLQPLALTAPTRAAVKAAGCLDELRDEVQRATGADAVPIAELERIKMRTVVTIGMSAVALWAIFPQLVGMSSVWGQLRAANWWWAAAAVALSAGTYVAATISFDGSVPERLPVGPTFGVQLATTFVGVAAPGGGLALSVRYLQKQGIDTPTAIGALSVDRIAGAMVHVTLTALFLALAGTSGLQTFELPSWTTVGLIVGVLLVLLVIALIIPWSRAIVRTKLLPATRRSFANVGEIARMPGKIIELFGGSLSITMGYILALEVSVAAFGTGPAFTSIALVYLVATAISNMAPTPGGLGAVEATLVAGLTSAGMPSTTAVAAVIMFRLATFWLPLLPGWVALAVLQRSGDL